MPTARRNVLKQFILGSPALLSPLLHTAVRAAGDQSSGQRRPVKRLVCVGNPFGFFPDEFFPKRPGANYDLPALLEPLAEHRDGFSVFSHLDHGLTGGHHAVHTFLSGVKSSDAAGRSEGNISLDQKVADFIGPATRFPSIHLGQGSNMSWTRNAVPVPSEGDSKKVFDALFTPDDPGVIHAKRGQAHLDTSVLDAVRQQAKLMQRSLGRGQNGKLDQYFTAIRDLERKLAMQALWLERPKPNVDARRPGDKSSADLTIRFELTVLALQTDSTRVATVWSNPANLTDMFNLTYPSYHKYSHHGRRRDLIDGLLVVESHQMKALARFFTRLKETEDSINGGTLFDHTITLVGSGLANGSSHSNTNMPVLLAGGGLKHGQHHVLPAEDGRRVPLNNLYTTILQKIGLETDRFNTSTGTLNELV